MEVSPARDRLTARDAVEDDGGDDELALKAELESLVAYANGAYEEATEGDDPPPKKPKKG